MGTNQNAQCLVLLLCRDRCLFFLRLPKFRRLWPLSTLVIHEVMIHPSVTHPVEPDPVDSFLLPSENLVSPVPSECFDFTQLFLCFPSDCPMWRTNKLTKNNNEDKTTVTTKVKSYRTFYQQFQSQNWKWFVLVGFWMITITLDNGSKLSTKSTLKGVSKFEKWH